MVLWYMAAWLTISMYISHLQPSVCLGVLLIVMFGVACLRRGRGCDGEVCVPLTKSVVHSVHDVRGLKVE